MVFIHRVRWLFIFYFVLLLISVNLFASTVTVQTDQSLDLQHPAIHILPFAEPFRAYYLPQTISHESKDNRIELSVEEGRYSIALTQVTPTTMTSLRSKTLTIKNLQPQRVALTHKQADLSVFCKDKSFQLHRVSIRGVDDAKFIHWQNPDSTSLVMPKLNITPSQTYQIMIQGSMNQTPVYFITETKLLKNQNTITIDPKRLNLIQFTINERSPFHISALLNLNLMVETIELNLDAAPAIYTNRRYLEASYRMTLGHLKTVRFGIKPIRAQRKTQVVLGGRWTVHPWVEAMKMKYQGKYVYPIYKRLVVTDEAGCVLHFDDLDNAGIEYQIVSKDGKTQLPTEYVDEKIWTNQKLISEFVCKVASLTSVVPTEDVAIERIYTYRTRHFEIHVPSSLQDVARMYMAKAEVAYNHTKPLAEFPGSDKIRIYLITNRSGAKGGWRGKRLGKKNGHISMPALHFIEKRNYQARVPHLQHEIFHTYGHRHKSDAEKKAYKVLERQTIGYWEAYAKTKALEADFLPPLKY